MKSGFASLLLGLLAAGAFAGQPLGLQLPTPPHQHAAWHPDAAIPTNILSAAQTLFEQGFPDPRGCEYREFEVTVSGVWDSKPSVVKTRGWVLPARSPEAPRFAICWNGLIYPVTNVAGLADLRAEVAAPTKGRDRYYSNAGGEAQTVLFGRASSTRALLLLRCGETERALKSWSPNPRLAEMSRTSGDRGDGTIDPYLELAGDWAWALFDRTICAHMRGEAGLALATARQLAEAQPRIESECARRGFRRQQYYDSARQGQPKPYLDSLEQLPQLVADLERRVKEERLGRSAPASITNQAERVRALITDLDQVQARQWSQPGGVNVAEDPIVSALIGEGDAAVDPLLDCLEHDRRLTRSVSFGRDFFRSRNVIPVSSAARTALLTILHAGFNGGAPEIRAFWSRYRGMKLEERWYAMLGDDAASGRWLEAAANIIQPENVTSFPGGLSTRAHASTNQPVPLRGEILRAKTNPSVSDLMARRALEAPATNPAAYELSAACQMSADLLAWDPKAGVPVADALVKRACTVMQYSGKALGPYVAQLSLACARGGDLEPLQDYAGWVKTTTPEQLDHSLMQCLEPLVSYPTNPVLQAAAQALFNTNSPWATLPWKGTRSENPAESSLVRVPAFRGLLARELAKTNVCGSFTWQAPNTLVYSITNYQNGSRGVVTLPGEPPANGITVELRWCDWIAWCLSNGKQIPPFNPFAPLGTRDGAIKNARALLVQP